MSKLKYVFLKHGGHIKCKISIAKKYSKDMEQSGFEFPARLEICNQVLNFSDGALERKSLMDK